MSHALDDLTATDRAAAARFDRLCRERIAPRAAAADRAAAVAPETWAELIDAGYFGLFHPPALGGRGEGGIVQALAMESLARACAGTFWTATISTLLVGKMLHDLAGPEHHERWLRPIIAGEKLGCFAATEQGAGSDPSSYRTTLTRGAGGLRLDGAKTCISNACTADVCVVLAREGAPDGPLRYVVVDLDRPGVRRREIDRIGLRAMSWGAIELDGVAVPEGDVIGGTNIEGALRSVEWGQLLQAWSAIGLAEAAFEACREHALGRAAFGRPLAHLPVVHGRLADMHADIQASRLLALEASRIKGEGGSARELVLLAKIDATEMAVGAADRAMRTFGGRGFDKAHGIERIYRDSLANVPAGLPTDRLRELYACALVGADPWTYPPFDWLGPAGLRLDPA